MLTQLKQNHRYRTSLLSLVTGAVGYTILKELQNQELHPSRIAGAEAFLFITVVIALLLAVGKWQRDRRQGVEKVKRLALGGTIMRYKRGRDGNWIRMS